MLSAETAAGAYPVEVIESMKRIIISVEETTDVYNKEHTPVEGDPLFYNDSLVLTACHLAETSRAKAIIGMTASGYTAFKLASHRPKADIFIFTHNRRLLNILGLIWGVRGFYYSSDESTDKTFADIEQILIEKGHIKKGDAFITTASMPLHDRGRTNAMKLNIVR
jgi:pyruvate kinase